MGLRTCFRVFRKWSRLECKRLLHGAKEGKDFNYKEVPIIINNFNRFGMLMKLIDSLTSRGYHNIYIIDNGSTYPPLLEWYVSCPYPVYFLKRNVGHLALWETGIYRQFQDSYFVYTDPDLEIHPDCPDDFMEKFIGLLRRHPQALKAGFSICIDDLPDCFRNKRQVVEWESQFWKNEIEPGAYRAPIDTTFAVCKPYLEVMDRNVDFKDMFIRTGFPYSVRHLPWYLDSSNLSEEEEYYISRISTSTHWSSQSR